MITLDGNTKVLVDGPVAKLQLENGSVAIRSYAGQQAGLHRQRMWQRSQFRGYLTAEDGNGGQQRRDHRSWTASIRQFALNRPSPTVPLHRDPFQRGSHDRSAGEGRRVLGFWRT